MMPKSVDKKQREEAGEEGESDKVDTVIAPHPPTLSRSLSCAERTGIM
jgi:hypothetical protein